MPQHQHVDYDQLARNYDRRFEVSRQIKTAPVLAALARELGAKRILEVGCGTGHWLAGLAPIAAGLYGLDLSARMLEEASRRETPLRLIRATASRLAVADRAFDFVYSINALHHFDDPRAFVQEAWRILRPGGALAVVGMSPHNQQSSWYVYGYFDGTYEADLDRFPSWGTVLDWMLAEGFELVEYRSVERIQQDWAGRGVLEDPFLQKDATSQLVLLSDEAYAAGLRRIEAALAEAEATGRQLIFRSDIDIGMIVAIKAVD